MRAAQPLGLGLCLALQHSGSQGREKEGAAQRPRTGGRVGRGREREPRVAAAAGLCLQAWAAGKGEVTSLLPGICCLETSPWRPEGSGWVKIANPRGCKFQERSLCKEREARACFWRAEASVPWSAGGASGFQAPPRHEVSLSLLPESFVPKQGVASVPGSQLGTSGSPELEGFLWARLGEVSAGGSLHRPPRLLPQKEEAEPWGHPHPRQASEGLRPVPQLPRKATPWGSSFQMRR